MGQSPRKEEKKQLEDDRPVNIEERCAWEPFARGATPSRASRPLETQETSCEALVIITSGALPPCLPWACVSQGGRAQC